MTFTFSDDAVSFCAYDIISDTQKAMPEAEKWISDVEKVVMFAHPAMPCHFSETQICAPALADLHDAR